MGDDGRYSLVLGPGMSSAHGCSRGLYLLAGWHRSFAADKCTYAEEKGDEGQRVEYVAHNSLRLSSWRREGGDAPLNVIVRLTFTSTLRQPARKLGELP